MNDIKETFNEFLIRTIFLICHIRLGSEEVKDLFTAAKQMMLQEGDRNCHYKHFKT